jgi:hypothetical protein
VCFFSELFSRRRHVALHINEWLNKSHELSRKCKRETDVDTFFPIFAFQQPSPSFRRYLLLCELLSLLSITMTSLSLRIMALRRLIHQSGKGKNMFRAGSSDSSFLGTASLRSLSTNTTFTKNEKVFQAKGFLDDRGLTIFETLHEMQVRSCQVFAPRKLFGTYSKESKQFEWMTYQEYDNAVNKCRAVLKDIGKS